VVFDLVGGDCTEAVVLVLKESGPHLVSAVQPVIGKEKMQRWHMFLSGQLMIGRWLRPVPPGAVLREEIGELPGRKDRGTIRTRIRSADRVM